MWPRGVQLSLARRDVIHLGPRETFFSRVPSFFSWWVTWLWLVRVIMFRLRGAVVFGNVKFPGASFSVRAFFTIVRTLIRAP